MMIKKLNFFQQNQKCYSKSPIKQKNIGAVALRIKYMEYSDNLMTNLLYFVVILLIAIVPIK